MSEPVGNSPRQPGAIPSNSHKTQREAEVKKKAEEPRGPVDKIIEGKVVTRKPSRLKRVARSFVADDVQNIGDYLLIDVVVPAVKNLIRDLVVGGTDRALYGRSRPTRNGIGGGAPTSFKTRYDKMSDGSEPRRMLSREARARHDFGEIILDDRAEAIGVIEALIARVDQYGVASVSDLYDFVGVSGSYADRSHGWRDLSTADVRQYRGGWLLDLPQPEPIR